MGGRVEWTISGWILDKISVLDSGELTEALDRQESCYRGSRRRWIVKNIVLEGSRRRRVEKNSGLENFRRRWMAKSCVLEGPEGVGSLNILFWRAPEGPGREN